jgi:hypothetical protein
MPYSEGDNGMSKDESPAEVEWKTIRISAVSYYKLVELSGFLTVLLGSQPTPLSTVAEWAIYVYYDSLHGKLEKILSDPKTLARARKEIGGNMKRLFEVWTKTKLE